VETIRPQEHLPTLLAIAAAEAIDLEGVEVVPSIRKWCEDHGLIEIHDHRMGKTVRNLQTGLARILLAEEITPLMRSSVVAALEINGFADEVARLESAEGFLTHLFLHELAHARDDNASEAQCDEWAFARMETYAA
jgi:superfamily II DNA/RNA helicase